MDSACSKMAEKVQTKVTIVGKKAKFTTGKILFGHFWHTNMWDLDPPPPFQYIPDTPPPLFSDISAPAWGTAPPGAEVAVAVEAETSRSGRFRVRQCFLCSFPKARPCPSAEPLRHRDCPAVFRRPPARPAGNGAPPPHSRAPPRALPAKGSGAGPRACGPPDVVSAQERDLQVARFSEDKSQDYALLMEDLRNEKHTIEEENARLVQQVAPPPHGPTSTRPSHTGSTRAPYTQARRHLPPACATAGYGGGHQSGRP